jgi:hypothetical protein
MKEATNYSVIARVLGVGKGRWRGGMTGLDEAEVFSVCEMILYESVKVHDIVNLIKLIVQMPWNEYRGLFCSCFWKLGGLRYWC